MLRLNKPNQRELAYAALAGVSSYVLAGVKLSRTPKQKAISALTSVSSYLVLASLGIYRD